MTEQVQISFGSAVTDLHDASELLDNWINGGYDAWLQGGFDNNAPEEMLGVLDGADVTDIKELKEGEPGTETVTVYATVDVSGVTDPRKKFQIFSALMIVHNDGGTQYGQPGLVDFMSLGVYV